jgi:hypothetical protein
MNQLPYSMVRLLKNLRSSWYLSSTGKGILDENLNVAAQGSYVRFEAFTAKICTRIVSGDQLDDGDRSSFRTFNSTLTRWSRRLQCLGYGEMFILKQNNTAFGALTDTQSA